MTTQLDDDDIAALRAIAQAGGAVNPDDADPDHMAYLSTWGYVAYRWLAECWTLTDAGWAAVEPEEG